MCDMTLVDLYNREVRIGITGVHNQALNIYAMSHVFKKRFSESPINFQDNILGLSRELEYRE